MKKIAIIFSAASLLLACTQKEYSSWNKPYQGDESFSHDEIVLGEQLDDPYSVRNMTKAAASPGSTQWCPWTSNSPRACATSV